MYKKYALNDYSMEAVLYRFFQKVRITDSCWWWQGSKSKQGYGMFMPGSDLPHKAAHRILYQILVGEIPHTHQIDHLCRNPSCVNPNHLECVTVSENIKRMWEYRRFRREFIISEKRIVWEKRTI